MVNTEKGEQTIKETNSQLTEVSFAEAIKSNPVYLDSVTEPQKRLKCFRLLARNKELNQIVEILQRDSYLIRMKRLIKRTLISVLNRLGLNK